MVVDCPGTGPFNFVLCYVDNEKQEKKGISSKEIESFESITVINNEELVMYFITIH